uniref:Uncharacterized protein n=1 Tax=Aegilops tauschii subsp. strangulata TaxID=200361 RepID=A0A453NXV2_AEGTS
GNMLVQDGLQCRVALKSLWKRNHGNSGKANALERAMVAGLGGLNLFGVIILGNLLKQMTMTPGGLISFAAQLFPLLQDICWLLFCNTII